MTKTLQIALENLRVISTSLTHRTKTRGIPTTESDGSNPLFSGISFLLPRDLDNVNH